MPRACVIPSCKTPTTSGKRFRFPNPRDHLDGYKEWVRILGVEKLAVEDPNDVYRKYRICDVHFTKEEIFPHGRLFRYAKPTLHLPVRPLISQDDDCIIIEDVTEEEEALEIPDDLGNKNAVASPSRPGTPISYDVIFPTPKVTSAIIAGINKSIFDNIKLMLQQMRGVDKFAVLLFGEIPIKPQIIINRHSKDFEGFEDMNDTVTPRINDYACVFMLNAITGKWKKLLGYTFCQGATLTHNLANVILDVIRHCVHIDLKIVATVSDHSRPNVAAVNYLCHRYGNGEHNTLKLYKVHDQELVHIYDPPHLLKGMRFNFLRNDLIWEKDEKVICAKWKHLRDTYQNDSPEIPYLWKIKEPHLHERTMWKIKVYHAAQVFSRSFAALMNFMARTGCIESSADQTSEVLIFFDRLFDSVNGHTVKPPEIKDLKCAVSATSGHAEYWTKSKKEISKMYFRGHGENQETKRKPPSLTNWLVTLNGLQYVSRKLRQDYRIKSFPPRKFCLDPLRNFFGKIRQLGEQNVNPNVTQFKQYFESVVTKNIFPTHSETVVPAVNANVDLDIQLLAAISEIPLKPMTLTCLDKWSMGYIRKFIAKNLKMFLKCEMCRKNIFCTGPASVWHAFLAKKGYAGSIPNKLRKFTPAFLEGFANVYEAIRQILPHICHKKHCIIHMAMTLKNSNLFCFNHSCDYVEQLQNTIIDKMCLLVSINWSRGINTILANKGGKRKASDPIYLQAIEYAAKRHKPR